jgi:hypothetical protein
VLGRFLGYASLTCATLACGTAAQQRDAGQSAAALAPPAPITIELPASVEVWRGALESDARELEQLLERSLARWPRVPGAAGAAPLRLVVLPSPLAAEQWCQLAGLPGDPRVPRTHSAQRLAVVPMVREDRLMSQRAQPPRTLRETLRHEMTHLLVLDRPGLAEAPLWFHEGLAEAWVSLRALDHIDADSHALGACWLSHLHSDPSGNAQEAVAAMPSELRYTGWAALVLSLLASEAGPRPWLAAQANPSLQDFRAEQAAYSEAHLGLALPQPMGRELDFVPNGRSVLLAAADGETVGLKARFWHGFEPFDLRVRVGQTGEPLAEILLGAVEAEQVLRIRLNGNGGIVAAWEDRAQPIPRAFHDRLPRGALQRWRDLELRPVRRADLAHASALGEAPFGILVRSGSYQIVLPIPAGLEAQPNAPWLLEFRVRSGAFELVSESPLVAALR